MTISKHKMASLGQESCFARLCFILFYFLTLMTSFLVKSMIVLFCWKYYAISLEKHWFLITALVFIIILRWKKLMHMFI